MVRCLVKHRDNFSLSYLPLLLTNVSPNGHAYIFHGTALMIAVIRCGSLTTLRSFH